jgi:elongation factor P
MLKHTEVKKGKIITIKGDPFEVTKYSHSVKGRGRSVVQLQLKNIRTGNSLQKTLHAGEEVEEAEIEEEKAVFIYSNRGRCFFHKEGDPSARFDLSAEQIGEKVDYLVEKTTTNLALFQDEVIGINLPTKMAFTVKEAPPGLKGDRVEGATKTVTLETGKKIVVPIFIKEGDLVEVNTETGEYSRRMQ